MCSNTFYVKSIVYLMDKFNLVVPLPYMAIIAFLYIHNSCIACA